jgi:hypothetical protein
MEQEQFIQRLKEVAVIKPFNNKNLREGFEVREIKHKPKTCEDCGKVTKDRRIWNRICITPVEPHWRKTCSSCNLTQNPVTKEYSVSNATVGSVFREFLSNRNK